MSNAPLTRIAARLSAPDDPPDRALLDRFATSRDEDAFALLVARHGPMVLAVCRRVLGNTPDADDAFQAAFLVLVRRATTVRDRDRLAGWLYGVAYRTALEARSIRGKRRRREATSAEPPDVPDRPSPYDPELAALVERELAALPEHYRAAVALSDLDGRPRSDTARLLGIPEGTLSSRLNVGRKLLASRLARHGYGLATVAVVTANTPAVPWPLVEVAVRGGLGAADRPVLLITEGVIKAMSTKSKLFTGLVAGLCVAGVLSAAVLSGGPPVNPTAVNAKFVDQPEGGDKKVSDALPVVVKTVPAAGAEDVDPATKEVSVTFSKKMADKSWTWAQDLGRGAALPSGDNKPAFDKDQKTCSLAVKLEPNTTYAVWLNGGNFMSFVDADGNPSLPYLLVFRTGKGK
jgi:RNA polymerase sigma factor (sigma-70 family)